MRVSRLLGAAIVLSVLTPTAPGNANTISPGDLMYTDLYKWQGQYGTPTWRQIIAQFDCTAAFNFYLWNTPSPPSPVTIASPPATDPVDPPGGAGDPPDPTGAPGGDSPDGASGVVLVDPVGTLPGGDPPGCVTAVPEPSTWVMLALGFAGLGYASFRRSRRTREQRAVCLRTRFARPPEGSERVN